MISKQDIVPDHDLEPRESGACPYCGESLDYYNAEELMNGFHADCFEENERSEE